MKQKKIFILVPDGVGLRNFAFTSFVQVAEQKGFKVIFWNETAFNLTDLGFQEIKLVGRPSALTDILKRSKIEAELEYFERKFEDPIYRSYHFPSANTNIKQKIKSGIVNWVAQKSNNENRLKKLRKLLKDSERKFDFYFKCKKILLEEKPDFVFCTNQRTLKAIAPLTAAEDLGIATGTFIFSWDNLPKATLIVEPEFYFVWSQYMKDELIKYYPHIPPKNILVTGTPQFEPHYNPALILSREQFFKENNLDNSKEYICFSGDDVTTSPDDPQYLMDLAEAVIKYNTTNDNMRILFRRCPTDFSDRYAQVIETFKDLIIPVDPKWKNFGKNWNAVLPTKEDLRLQVNTIYHTKAVVNLGSSMVFDYAAFDKPCFYINYDSGSKSDSNWSTEKIYSFVHFRSMPSPEAVIWLNSKDEIPGKLEEGLRNTSGVVNQAKTWFEKINHPSPKMASKRIWNFIEEIL